jgi:hypothetical protein
MSNFDFRTVIKSGPLPPDRIRQEILTRLRWSLLGPVEGVMIEDGLKEDGTEKLRPFLSHALAMEDVAVPPTSRLSIYNKDVNTYMFYDRVPAEQQPRPVVIEHADGTSISIKEFVIAVHAFMSQHKDMVIDNRKFLVRAPLLPIEVPEPESADLNFDPSKHDLLFRRASGTSFETGMLVSIEVFLEGEMGKTTEIFWKDQRDVAIELATRRARLEEGQGLK